MVRVLAGNRFVVRDFGSCLKLNGTSDLVDIGNLGNFGSVNLAGSTSYTAWIKTNQTSTFTLLGFANTGSNTQLNLLLNATSGGSTLRNSVRIFLRADGGATLVKYAASNISFTNGLWHHVVIVLTPSTNTVRFFVDSVEQTVNNEVSATPSSFSNAGFNCYIGALNNRGSGANFFSGLVDEPRIYTTALGQTDVTNLYYGYGEVGTALFRRFKFDEGSGTIAADSSANTINGTITGATYSTDVAFRPRLIAPATGTALSFDGTASKVAVASVSAQNNLTDISLAMWLYPTANSQYRGPVWKGPAGARRFNVQFDNSFGLCFVAGWSGAIATYSIPGSLLPLNQWTHFAITYSFSATSNVPSIYINGLAQTVTTRISASGSPNADSSKFDIGVVADTYFWSGYMDEFRYYNAILTSANIQDLAKKLDVASGLVGQYKFDEIVGSIAVDGTGNANGTITNGTYIRGVFGRLIAG